MKFLNFKNLIKKKHLEKEDKKENVKEEKGDTQKKRKITNANEIKYSAAHKHLRLSCRVRRRQLYHKCCRHCCCYVFVV